MPLAQVHHSPVQARFLRRKPDQMTMHRGLDTRFQRRTGRLRHFIVQDVNQPRIPSPVQFISAILGLDGIPHRFAFMRQQNQVCAKMLPVAFTTF